MSPKKTNPDAANRLARAIGMAASRQRPTTGAVLGRVVSTTPTIDVELDTGQFVPQVAGPPGLQPGDRVLCHYINQGHDIAISTALRDATED